MQTPLTPSNYNTPTLFTPFVTRVCKIGNIFKPLKTFAFKEINLIYNNGCMFYNKLFMGLVITSPLFMSYVYFCPRHIKK